MRLLRRLLARLETLAESDTAFIERAYREALGRPVDQDGLNHYRRVLRDGAKRSWLLLDLARSAEFARGHGAAPEQAPTAVSLFGLRPDRYRKAVDTSNGLTIDVFEAASPDDFDWLESAILEHQYYERPGVWNFSVDIDKRVMAEIVLCLQPRRALELGCASGAVLECLLEAGVGAEGVEISDMARAKASDRVRPSIHLGDILTLSLEPIYDVAFGLDVFEHLNPNRLNSYLARLAWLLRPGGYLFANIPAFGHDPVFGKVFPHYLDAWHRDTTSTGPFSTLHVDDDGFPIHGHLIWADSAWWVQQFERQGLVREDAIERELHRRYDGYMTKRAPARRAFYVFSKRAGAARTGDIAEAIRRGRSKVLMD